MKPGERVQVRIQGRYRGKLFEGETERGLLFTLYCPCCGWKLYVLEREKALTMAAKHATRVHQDRIAWPYASRRR